jgi:hypothetical protein
MCSGHAINVEYHAERGAAREYCSGKLRVLTFIRALE